uniref:Uncharacterized protein n=1 Tax=Anguilla anguilla TaxID=7936 RepID=A0A0E9W3R6_ANGAN
MADDMTDNMLILSMISQVFALILRSSFLSGGLGDA